MIVVAGSVPIKPEKLEELRMAAQVVCAATREEKGCVSYDFSLDLQSPTLMRVFERWETNGDLDAHLAQAHTKRFLDQLGAMAAGAPDVKRYIVERVEDL